jgi:hypothetical protein
MRRALVSAIGMFCLARGLLAQVDRIGVDPRVELFSLIFRLAGSPEYAQGRIPAYNQAVDNWFAPYRNHEAVANARQLRQTSGIAYDAVVSLAIHVTDAATLAERSPIDRPGVRLDRRWRPAEARRFLQLARDFTETSRFAEFLASQKSLYDVTSTRHQALVATADLAWFGRFFGSGASERFEVVSGLLTGTSSYGPSVIAEDGTLEVYAIQGIPSVDEEGLPVLPSGYLSNLVHELTHSYANPLVDRYMSSLEAAGRRLYQATQADMQPQGYSLSAAVLYETLVRACSLRYTLEHQGEAAARQSVDYEHARGFVWIGELNRVLAGYEADRTTYPALFDFMPVLAAALDDISWRAPDLYKLYEDSRPRVVSATPENGARDVDPARTDIVLTFDRPMRTGYSLSSGATAPLPKLVRLGWDETGTIFTIECRLEPGKNYELRFNPANSGSFASAEGYALRQYTIAFRTADAP